MIVSAVLSDLGPSAFLRACSEAKGRSWDQLSLDQARKELNAWVSLSQPTTSTSTCGASFASFASGVLHRFPADSAFALWLHQSQPSSRTWSDAAHLRLLGRVVHCFFVSLAQGRHAAQAGGHGDGLVQPGDEDGDGLVQVQPDLRQTDGRIGQDAPVSTYHADHIKVAAFFIAHLVLACAEVGLC